MNRLAPVGLSLSLLYIIVGLLFASHAFGQTSVKVVGSKKVIDFADVSVTTSATLVRTANPKRYALNCTIGAEGNVRWGASTVTALRGQQLITGTAIEIRSVDSIYMIGEAGTVTVSCNEELQ